MPEITEPATPAPGVYVVGEFRGVRQLNANNGDVHHFVQVLTDNTMIELYCNAKNLMEYSQKPVGEQVIISADVSARKDKRTGAFTGEIGYGLKREAK